MHFELASETFFEKLISGDRAGARRVVADLTGNGANPVDLLNELFWPTYEDVEKLARQDKLGAMPYNMATRLLRLLVDQNSARMTIPAATGRRILAFCGKQDGHDLGAQMAVDLLEWSGFHVTFAGGGIAVDDIMGYVNEHKPDVVLAFASAAEDLPNIRSLIDQLKAIGACPNVQFAVGGGVFNRAEGLAEEVGADLWAESPMEIAQLLIEEPNRRATADQRTVGKSKVATPGRKVA